MSRDNIQPHYEISTLERIREALADEDSFHVPSEVIEWLDDQIEHCELTGRQANKLPPDPDGMNDSRAEWAVHALDAFMWQAGADRPSAVTDLLCDLMHLADCDGSNFADDLERARMHYASETQPGFDDDSIITSTMKGTDQ